jgi:hypothetical protein
LARRDVSGATVTRASAARRTTARTVSATAAAAGTGRRNGRFDPHVLILTAFSRRLDRGGKAHFSFLADLELGLAIKNLDLANILLGDVACAAD